MELREVYERYEHLDPILSDMRPEHIKDQILFDLWQAVKEAVKEGK